PVDAARALGGGLQERQREVLCAGRLGLCGDARRVGREVGLVIRRVHVGGQRRVGERRGRNGSAEDRGGRRRGGEGKPVAKSHAYSFCPPGRRPGGLPGFVLCQNVDLWDVPAGDADDRSVALQVG